MSYDKWPTPTHAVIRSIPKIPVETDTRCSRDNLSPDDMSLDVLDEETRGLQIVLHSRAENSVARFMKDVRWFTENPRIVHGVQPSIEHAVFSERCHLCLQHALSRSLPSALRQKYLRHDHSYASMQPHGNISLVTEVALCLIERNYLDAFARLISNAEERTNPFRISAIEENTCSRGEKLQNRVIVEDLEKILSSPWAIFEEVEIRSNPAMFLTGPQPEEKLLQRALHPEHIVAVPRDETFFIVKTLSNKDNPKLRTNIVIEKYCPTLKTSCAGTESTAGASLSNGKPQRTFHAIGRSSHGAHQRNQSSVNVGGKGAESSHAEGSASAREAGTEATLNIQDARSKVLQEERILNSIRRAKSAAVIRSRPYEILPDPSKLSTGRLAMGTQEDRTEVSNTSRICDSMMLESSLDLNRSAVLSSFPNGTAEGPRVVKVLTENGNGSQLCKSKILRVASDSEILVNPAPKRSRVDVVAPTKNDRAMTWSLYPPISEWNSVTARTSCSCCNRDRVPWLRNHSLPIQPARPVQRLDQQVPLGGGAGANCPSDSRIGNARRSQYAPTGQSESAEGNRFSAECPTCGIVFRAFGIVQGAPKVILTANPSNRLRDHAVAHKTDALDCVYPSCKRVTFKSRQELVAHMDLHRQSVIVAGIEMWENKNATLSPSVFQPARPHLTCEICLIDFNWRTTLSGMLSHIERYKKHCEQHRVKKSGPDHCLWHCVLGGCERKFASQSALEEHMWMTHAARCHCSTCDWIVWGDTDEVCLHRKNCTAQLTDVDFEQSGMKPPARSATPPSVSEIATNRCSETSPTASTSVFVPVSRQRLKLLSKKKVTKAGEQTPATFDTASTANHMMRFSFYCDFCGAPFRSHHSNQFHRHVQSHLPDKQLTCVVKNCGRQFTSAQELHSHVKTKLSTCRHCGAVLFSTYKKHILTCRPLHEIKKQRMLREEFARMTYTPVQREDLFWSRRELCRASSMPEQSAPVPNCESQECFLRNLDLIKGSLETVKAKTRKHAQLRSQIHVANGKGRRACTKKTSCTKCGRIFLNGLNLKEHMRGFHNSIHI